MQLHALQIAVPILIASAEVVPFCILKLLMPCNAEGDIEAGMTVHTYLMHTSAAPSNLIHQLGRKLNHP